MRRDLGTTRSLFGRTGRISVIAAIAILSLTFAPGIGHAAVTPVAVLTGPEEQYQAFANETYLAWTSNSISHPNRWNALIRPIDGGTTRRVNAKGTLGFTGNFDPGTDQLIYGQIANASEDIYVYDASSRTRTKVTDISTRKDEWQPKISNTFILFQRSHKTDGKWYADVLLYDRATQLTKTLGTWPTSRVIRTGNVGQRYATFFVGSRKGYSPFLYDSETDTRTKIPSPQPWAWAPLVDETNGTVYFASSGDHCGQNANIWRLPISLTGPTTKIVDLPDGVDIGWVMSLAPNSISGLDLLFYRLACSKDQGDVYKAEQVDQVT
jgi:hypothetical protein